MSELSREVPPDNLPKKKKRLARFRIHQYDYPYQPMPDMAPDWNQRMCVHCAHKTGLGERQLRSMPPDMAQCDNGKRAITRVLLAKFDLFDINCLKKS